MSGIPQHVLDAVMGTYRAWRPFADALEAERAEHDAPSGIEAGDRGGDSAFTAEPGATPFVDGES